MSPGRRALGALRSLGAALSGYVAIIVSTTVGFGSLGGIVHLAAPLRLHLLATAVAIVSGLLGGMVAAWVGGRLPIQHALGAAAFVAAETIVLLSAMPSADPLWFDLLGAATLFTATVAGGFLWGIRRR
jgi:hypothetical protein